MIWQLYKNTYSYVLLIYWVHGRNIITHAYFRLLQALFAYSEIFYLIIISNSFDKMGFSRLFFPQRIYRSWQLNFELVNSAVLYWVCMCVSLC